MKALGIESSCDETAAAVVTDDGRVLSDVVHSQVAIHAPHGGVVPELASRDHLRNASFVVEAALAQAEVSLSDIDLVAVTNRPGLVGGLLVGVQVAKGLAWAAGKPLYGVDHLMGHLLSIFLVRGNGEPRARPAFPFVALLASGGHTALYRVDGRSPLRVIELGATRDDAAGEAYDKVGKLLGLGYPGGPVIDRLARDGDPTAIVFSAPMARRDSLELSFSGLKTQVAAWVQREGRPEGQRLFDLCAAFQATVVHSLAHKLVRAAEMEGVARVVIGGGVAANRGLRDLVAEMAAARGLEAFVPDIPSCTDNAAMIALAGSARAAEGEPDGWDLIATSQTLLPRKTRKGRGSRVSVGS
jgi:N6-L-threonylcarbamoyladenine synthase